MTASSGNLELAVVTGASTGIGAATAHELARRGFHVLAGVRRDADADTGMGARVEPLSFDITSTVHLRPLVARARDEPQRRGVGAVVTTAGGGVKVPAELYR